MDSERYTLYLDESETHDFGKNKIFSIAGIVVKDSFHNSTLIQELNNLKKIIWKECVEPEKIILHEKEIRYVQNKYNKFKLDDVKPEFKRFRNPNNSMKLYAGLEKIIRNKEVNILGTCIVNDELNKCFNSDILNDKTLIAMQVIMENYCHFLINNNGIGKISYESVGYVPNKIMSLRFHHIKAMGTMYIEPYAMQSLITSIDFPLKSENIAGLQIADFIPNDIARNVSGKNVHIFSLKKEITNSMYDGGLKRKDKYGVKVIPRIP
ncbi:DUF3800 domain-containing protein [Clostridium tagluense]|uniref:DUF3800 domain-containing protein n=1 Tax=Clostridium tagluense TaxID=360422 RepID=UPI001CF591D8|nr:DUF3800 domain-containing protein [Clostridium tagluense]MCB2297040.1 DUF3800 domain-containing protein [Clostridium tagluense]